ncbi:MAG: carboxypeptidase regulatory-like domain-containing protein [Bacteroidetes bacterium]|nr:carboxypeptidase regulatory-like domain-containing protein [Bacteroidota bacterium]
MKKHVIELCLLAAVVCTGSGCTDEWSFTSKASAASLPVPGKIIGYVGLRDERGGGILDTGVTVTLSNNAPVKTMTTDIHGRFQFDSIAPGSYDITYEKAGYGTFKTFGLVLPGGNTPVSAGKINLVKVTSTVVDSLAIDTTASDHITLSAYIHPSLDDSTGGSISTARFFVGMDDPNVSCSSYIFSDSDYGNVSWDGGKRIVQYCLPLSQVNGYVIKNLPLYAVAYGAPSDNSAYFDIGTGNTVWPALSIAKSNVVTFQVH